MAANPYSLIQNSNYKFYDDRGHITPNFEYAEGIRPAGSFMPAPYLPEVRFNVYFEEWFVLSGGKVVAMDSNGNIVPAGLKKEAEAYKAEFDLNGEAAADAAATILYSADDVNKRGVKNAAGVAATVGEPVVKSFFDITGGAPLAQNVTVSNPVGVSSYNYWAHPGGDGENPADYHTHNFNLQNKVAFVCDYMLQLPVVLDKATYDAAPFAGMGVLLSAEPKPGEFVTFDADSNFVNIPGYGYGGNDGGEILGQILSVDLNPAPKALLDKVRTRYDQFGDLEKMPGTATGGQPDSLVYSGGYGLVTINLQNR